MSLVRADARAIPLRDESVQCIVTSPPYWGLRDYGTARWEGGAAGCQHFKLAGGIGAQRLGKSAAASPANVERASVPFREVCGLCGARRIDAQIGLEPTPDAYVENIVAVFRECRRVLAVDGVLWLNLGDSYASSAPGTRQTEPGRIAHRPDWRGQAGLKAKDLVGIPWRVAFALQADGWWLRSDVIWSKPNPMPESITDRPTKAHEYVFLLAKSERYFYDAAAIKERSLDPESYRPRGPRSPDKRLSDRFFATKVGDHATGQTYEKRNARTVWTIATRPTPDAHFATFPEALARRCILAGSRPGDRVLDPFSGSGTTVKAARNLGRVGIGLELSAEYNEIARGKIRTTLGLDLAYNWTMAKSELRNPAESQVEKVEAPGIEPAADMHK